MPAQHTTPPSGKNTARGTGPGRPKDLGKRAAILDAAARRDPRVKVVHKPNAGLTRALIDGCALAAAPWIARQDADDAVQPDGRG